jgi:hypothetical protein
MLQSSRLGVGLRYQVAPWEDQRDIMRLSRKLFLVGIVASIFGRAYAAARKVKLVGEDGWVDLDLPLTEFKGDSNVYRLIAKGLLDGTSVGLRVEIDGHWNSKPTEDGAVTLYWGSVTLRSIGLESDALAVALSRLYGYPHAGLRMLPEIRAEAVGLASDPRLIESEPVKMKLFFHSENEERYAEVFLNIDRGAQIVELHEKDPEYRKNLIRALTEQA